MHTYVRTYIHAYLYLCKHTYIHACIHTYIQACIYTYMYIYIYIHAQVACRADSLHRARKYCEAVAYLEQVSATLASPTHRSHVEILWRLARAYYEVACADRDMSRADRHTAVRCAGLALSVRMCFCLCVCVCMCVCMRMCMYVYVLCRLFPYTGVSVMHVAQACMWMYVCTRRHEHACRS
jgi:hypothetical protein